MTPTPFTSRKGTAGFTLLELLLTVGLLGLLLAGLYSILNNWTERAVDRQAAADMLRVRTAAHDYVLANFDRFRADAGGPFIEVPINDMKPDNYLPSGYIPYNAYRQTIRVFRRTLATPQLNADGSITLDSAGNAVMLDTIEVVVIADNPPGDTVRTGNKRLIDAVTAAGPTMGMSSQLVMPNGTFTGLVTSLQNQWSVPLVSLSAVGYTATPDTAGGYLATYDIVSSESSDANDHWLYRVPVTGRPELNRMATNLNMNANELQNIGTVVADKYTIDGNAAFRGQAQGVTADTAQGMTVEQALRVDTGGEVRMNMKSNTTGCSFAAAPGNNRTLTGGGCAVTGGEMQTVGENRVNPANGTIIAPAGDGEMGVTNAVTADGNVITDYTNVLGTTDVAGISTFSTVNGNQMETSTTAMAPTVNVTGGATLGGTVQTQQFQAAAMDITSGATIGNQLVAARAAPGLGHSFTTNSMDVGNAVDITGKLGAANETATNTLYIDNAINSYQDPVMSSPPNHPVPRTVICTAYGGATYCEPSGNTWYSDTLWDYCTIGGTGYSCTYYRIDPVNGQQTLGSCNFTRSRGASGQAYEAYSCT